MNLLSKLKCESCSYFTYDKSNFIKHEKSKKHMDRTSQFLLESKNDSDFACSDFLESAEFICQYCNHIFVNQNNLTRHLHSCIVKISIDKNKLDKHEYEIENLKIRLACKDELLDQKNELIDTLKMENAFLKKLVENAGLYIKTSMSSMAYVLKYYGDAPPLKQLNDYIPIRYDLTDSEFVETLISEFNQGTLAMYCGDFLIQKYKKDNPNQQSIWCCDTNRLNYIIRNVSDDGIIDWKIDKKGVETTKHIIKPLVDFIDPLVRQYLNNFDQSYYKCTALDTKIKLAQIKSVTEIIVCIEDKTLCYFILKYLAPHLYLDKYMNKLTIKN